MIKKHKLLSRGFTLVELLIVVVVLAILATITVSAYQNINARAEAALVQADMTNNIKRVQKYNAENDVYPRPAQLSALDIEGKDYKMKVSKRNVYTVMNYCVTSPYWGGAPNGAILSAETRSGKIYVATSFDGLRDVTDTAASSGCGSFAKPGYVVTESRGLIQRSGAVEAGFVKVLAP